MLKASASGMMAMAFAAVARRNGMRHVILATSGRLTGPLADAVQ
jgi:NADPH-dependent 2,4-dienoyl-CoA reductase/sulfur reductase-like enzyme